MSKRPTVGVIVARFQTPRLTPGHVHLLNTALLQNDKVLLYLGCSPLKNDRQDPIDFVWRAAMVQSEPRLFIAGKTLIINQINDCGDNGVWSDKLEAEVRKETCAADLVRLYGSRDSSFLTAFGDRYETVELIPFSDFSATEIRQQTARMYPTGTEADVGVRQGMVIAAHSRYPSVVSTVDVAILESFHGTAGIWLGRKPNSAMFRFIGGFCEPKSLSDEEDAIREAKEETGLIVDDVTYIGNAQIDDWRFRKSCDKIRTRFFAARVRGGIASADDDIAEIRWFSYSEFKMSPIVSEHGALKQMFIDWVERTSEGLNYFAKVMKFI